MDSVTDVLLFKKMYNILLNEREVESMSLKPFSSQISIFLSDGIMNPSRYVDEINDNFNGVFTKQNYSLNIDEAPNNVPLVRYSSKDGKYIYDFAKKRINFYLNFNENDSTPLFEEYKANVEKSVKNLILNILIQIWWEDKTEFIKLRKWNLRRSM